MQSLELPVADDYAPSNGELNNLVYLTCKYTVGWGMRQTDLAVCLMMAGGEEEIRGNKGLSNLCWVTCEYLWDHVAGEPTDINPEQLFDHIKPALQTWYENQTPEQRSSIE
jgi:hypothetical protein